MHTQSTSTTKTPLKQTLFDRIESEQLTPHSRLFFRGRECLVWSVWLLSVIVGAFAVAVSMFVVTHRQYELYEATHENFFTFMVEVLPYMWMFAFVVMVYVAIYNLRHTKHGYRYPVSVILVSSLVLSFAGGSALQFFGFGYTIDSILGSNMDVYMSQVKLEQKLWQTPEDGRLIGRQIFSTVAPTSTIIFEDIQGKRWTMDVQELMPRDRELLATAQTVRMLGEVTSSETCSFHACGAFPWMTTKNASQAEMLETREQFVEQVYRYIEQARLEDELMAMRATDGFAVEQPQKSICMGIAAVQRMPVPAY